MKYSIELQRERINLIKYLKASKNKTILEKAEII